MTPLRALIIEDSEDDTALLVRELRHGGYDPSHVRVETAETMRMELSSRTWDIVLSDFTMPQFNAFSALELLRSTHQDIPFIIVSGTIGEDRAVTAMKAGAHDYILKGNMKRLVPAVERELRDAHSRKELAFQNEEKDKRTAELVIANKELAFQNEEKEKRAAELVIANKELAFQNEEKEKRAAELTIANKELQDSLEDTVRAIATIVEMRDPYTSGHQVRVADVAAAIAGQMGLSDEQVHAIHLAGLVHDLGKIQIPAEILSKPGKLTELEYMLIQVHPQAGYDILKGIDFPWPIAQMVLQHHERLDGSGYPQGLKGEAILLEARILSVADVVEAMSSHRPYRPGLGIEVALAEITRQRGIHFDPAVVDACLAAFNEQHYAFKS